MNFKELVVIMPIYNEEKAITAVFEKWYAEFTKLQIDFEIHAYNDGSTDQTAIILKKMAARYPRIIVHQKTNSGHGPTILQGYRENSGAEWLFQIDSDDELEVAAFDKLWLKRFDYDFLVGVRVGRHNPVSRKIMTFGSKLVVRLFYHSGILDTNSPYRLMRSNKFKDLFFKLRANTFAPNVIISGYAALKKFRIFQTPAYYHQRTTGEVSLKKLKLLKAAGRSLGQAVSFRFKL